MKRIPLLHGLFTLIDDEDVALISKYKWIAHRQRGQQYVISRTGGRFLYLHREIMKTPKGMATDHINGDGLDNRRSNLRICTRAENSRNQKKRPWSLAKYKGMHFDKINKRWRVQIVINRKRIHIGRYKTELEAASAYDEAARKYFGKFARTNF